MPSSGNLEEAETHLLEVLALVRELASKSGVAYALGNLGDVARMRGRFEQAGAYLRESLLLARELGDTYLLLGSLAERAKLAAVQGRAERAVRLAGVEAKLREERGMAVDVGELARMEQALERAHDQLGEEAFRRTWENGQAMELEEAVAYALDGGTASADRPVVHAPDTAAPTPVEAR
jgi:ATP/maltotriose-dependent transcriptional regulator MalT